MSMYTVEEGYWRTPEELLRLLGAQPSRVELSSTQQSGVAVVRVAKLVARPSRARRAQSSHCASLEDDPTPAKRAASVSPLRLADAGTEPPQQRAFPGTKRKSGRPRQLVEHTAPASAVEVEPELAHTSRIAGEEVPHPRSQWRHSKQPEFFDLATHEHDSKDFTLQPLVRVPRRQRASAREEPTHLFTPLSSTVSEDEHQPSLAVPARQGGRLGSGPKNWRLKNMHLSKQTRSIESDDDFSVSVATEVSPVDAGSAIHADNFDHVSRSRQATGTSPVEVMSVHSDHPAVSSTNALSLNALMPNARSVSRLANGSRRLTPPLMNTQRGKGSPSAVLKPLSGEIVVDRRDGGKLRVIAVPADGNCGYECLARGVNATLPRPSSTRNDIRRAMQTYVRSNRESVQALVNVLIVNEKRFGNIVPSLETFDKAIMKKGTSCHWLGSSYGLVEIMIAAKAVGMIIELYAVEPPPRSGNSHGLERPARTVRSYERVGSGANVIRLLCQGKSSTAHFSLLLRA